MRQLHSGKLTWVPKAVFPFSAAFPKNSRKVDTKSLIPRANFICTLCGAFFTVISFNEEESFQIFLCILLLLPPPSSLLLLLELITLIDDGELVVVVVASTSSTLAVEENSDEKTNLCCALKDKLPLDSKLINMLWRKDWRKRLCRCQACILMYENLKVSFLISEIEEDEEEDQDDDDDDDEQDQEEEQPNTIKILPTTTTTTTSSSSSSSSRRRRRRRRNIWNDSSSLQEITIEKTPHVVQMELARGINDFVSTFREFFGKAAENGKTAFGTQDVSDFVEELKKKRRRKS